MKKSEIVVGMGASLGAALSTMLTSYNEWMEAISLTVGVVIGVLTIVKLVRDLRKPKAND